MKKLANELEADKDEAVEIVCLDAEKELEWRGGFGGVSIGKRARAGGGFGGKECTRPFV